MTKDDEIVRLTPLEFRILYMLAMNPGRVIPYSRLVEYAWGYEGGDSNLRKTHTCHIRSKLGLPVDGSSGIRAVQGVGTPCLERPDLLPTLIEAEPTSIRLPTVCVPGRFHKW